VTCPINTSIVLLKSPSEVSPTLRSTPQGYDEVFGVNYLSHFLLTEKLLPSLKRSKLVNGSRIIQIASSMHLMVNGDDLVPSMSSSSVAPYASQPSSSSLHSMRSYGNSKLAQIYHARSLTRELEADKDNKGAPVQVVSVCPSWVATPIKGASFKNVLDIFAFQSDGFGVAPILFAMFHRDVGASGDYVTSCSVLDGKVLACTEVAASLVSIPFYREIFLSIASMVFLGLGLQKIFANVGFRATSIDAYDVTKQDALYKWSKVAIEPWM